MMQIWKMPELVFRHFPKMHRPSSKAPWLSPQALIPLCSLVVIVICLRELWGLPVSLVIGMGLAIIVGMRWTRRLTEPLGRLTQLAKAYATGNFSIPTQHTSVRELRELTDAMSTLGQSIRAQVDELTAQHHQATAILDSMAEGVIAVDLQGRVLLMNPAAGMLLGVAPQSSIGRSLLEAVRNHGLQELARGLLQDRQRVTKDITFLQPQARILRVHGVPCEGDRSSGLRAVFVLQDVTESHRYDQLRKEFVANVSHELKSPITAILGLTETLLEGALEDRANNRRLVQLIDEDARRLSRLIDDLLALSQIESQAVPLKLSVVGLRALTESVLASLQPAVAQKRLQVSVELSEGLLVRADPDRLRQILANLLDNAVKYNKEGGTITLSAIQDGNTAKVTVADTGIGIPSQDLPRIFERFYRVDKARSRELGGTGLGLSIVKHILDAHGGSICVESQLNQGSQFSFTIPLAS